MTPVTMCIVYLYSHYQDNYDKIKEGLSVVVKEYQHQDISSDIGDSTLLVLDDLMTITGSCKKNLENFNNSPKRFTQGHTCYFCMSRFMLW